MGEADDAIQALVALTGVDLSHLNTLAPFEERKIVLAQGKQFQNADGIPLSMPGSLAQTGRERAASDARFPAFAPSLLPLPAIPLVEGPTDTFRFFNAQQGVLFTIKRVTTKTDFVTALMTPGVHVVYAGHARFGRGPCFGDGGSTKGEEWEEGHGTHPNADGIFRLGFPFIGVPVGDLFEHGYTANLTRAAVPLAAADCEPDLRRALSSATGHTLAEIAQVAVTTHEFQSDAELSALTVDDVIAGLAAQVRNPDPAALFWTYRGGGAINVVHIADWQNTLSTPDDIGPTTPVCRVFAHFGCSTFIHNHPVVRHLKNWRHEGNERYAYWTTDLANFTAPVYWLQHLLTYDQFNANQSWERSLAYAVQRTNAALARDREPYRVI